MDIQKISTGKIRMAGYNPRKDLKPGDVEYEKLKRSIEEFGYVEPLVWNQRTGNIIGGHQRYKILLELGYEEVECVILDLDETKEKALNVALNKISGEWDIPLLTDLLTEMNESGFDITITGFDLSELEELITNRYGIEDDGFDVDAALKEEAFSKPDDLWLLGRNRLICADSTDPKTYEILMDGRKANLVVTDPPYNIDITGGTRDKLKIKNDNLPDKEFYEFLLKFYKCTYDVMEDGAAIYVFHADTEGINFRTALKEAGFHLSGVCIWVKDSLVLGRMDYHFRHEPIIYGWKPTGKHKWYSDRKQNTIWEFDRPKRNELHPTMKPVPLVAYPITNSSMSNCIVLDPFVGSFSTGIACEKTNRICYAIELDPRYVDVCVERFLMNVRRPDDIRLVRNGSILSFDDVKKLDREDRWSEWQDPDWKI